MNFFQSLVLAVFGLIALAAVIIFSMSSGGGGNLTFSGTFKIWGTLPAESLRMTLDDFNNVNSKSFKIEYTQKNVDTFQNDLISALAAGSGPDLVILPESLIVQNADKVSLISYDTYPARNFSDDFSNGSALFMSKNGIIAIPLYIDPLVMYWNKDIFSSGGIASFPTKWSEFDNLTTKLTVADQRGNITQSAIALGSYANIEHAKDILAALFLQSGNELIRFAKEGETNSSGAATLYTVLIGGFGSNAGPESALSFFLNFSNPAKKAYSWNVSLPNSKTAFSGGTLGVYLGHASDYSDIQKINPHLNFDVAVIPQRDNDKNRTTFGNIYGVAVTKGSTNPDLAKQIAIQMSGTDFDKMLSSAIGLPPARRDLLAVGSADPAASVFYSSAIISKSWLDPSPIETNQIFQDMTDSVTSGIKSVTDAVNILGKELDNMVKNIK